MARFAAAVALLACAVACAADTHTIIQVPQAPIRKRTFLPTNYTPTPYPLPDKVWHFIPLTIGAAIPGEPALTFSAPCFGTNKVTAKKTDTGYEVDFEASHKSSLLCSDGYLIATPSSFHVHYLELGGNHKFEWKGNFTPAMTYDADKNGFRVFRFPDGMVTTLDEVVATAELFIGALLTRDVPQWTANDNAKFIREYTNWNIQTRTTQDVEVPQSMIQSGDMIVILRMDGLDPMIAWGTGGRTGHTATALWRDGELYVCESQVRNSYWPTANIQCNPWTLWLKLAKEAHYSVAVLPLSPANAATFNANMPKALAWLDSVLGLPYGYHNFIFGWIDTAEDNFPPPLTGSLAVIVLSMLEQLGGASSANSTGDMWAQGLNQRLGTYGLSVADAYMTAEQRGMTLADLYTMPENDAWIYEDANVGRKGPSMVCDVFVLSLWKAAGLFGSLDIMMTEFTPFDAYQLAMFDANFVRPAQCVAADPTLPFCQIMGEYRLDLAGYNTAAPFEHMRETCPGIPPNYVRPENC